MKKSRILALLFCLVMLAGFLPPQAQAAGVSRFEADTLDSPGPIWTYTRIRVSVDTGSMTATVSFRRYRDDTDWEYIENNYPDLLSDSHTICSNTYGFLTADARPIGDKGTTYELTNLQWQTEPYIFDGGEVSGKILVKYTTLLFESGYVYIRPSARLDYPSAFCGVEMGSGTKFNLTDDDVEYLDANPTPQNRDYTIGRDNFGFVNRRDSFFQTGGTPPALVESLKDDPQSPVVVGFSCSAAENGKRVSHGHAVLAFKVEDSPSYTEQYIVSVYDPNDPTETNYLRRAEQLGAALYQQDQLCHLALQRRARHGRRRERPLLSEGPVHDRAGDRDDAAHV